MLSLFAFMRVHLRLTFPSKQWLAPAEVRQVEDFGVEDEAGAGAAQGREDLLDDCLVGRIGGFDGVERAVRSGDAVRKIAQGVVRAEGLAAEGVDGGPGD